MPRPTWPPSTSVIGSLGCRGPGRGRLVGRSVSGPAVLRPVGTGTGSMPRPLRTSVQLGQEGAGVQRPAGRVAAGGARDQLVDLPRQPGHLGRRRGHVVVHVLVGHRQRRVPAVGRVAGEHLVQHDPGGVDVAAGVGAAALELLGGQVGDGADEHAAGLAGLPGADDGAGQAEVGDLDHAVDADEHVLGLDVAVHDAGPVGGGEPGQHRLEDGERLGDGRAGRGRAAGRAACGRGPAP